MTGPHPSGWRRRCARSCRRPPARPAPYAAPGQEGRARGRTDPSPGAGRAPCRFTLRGRAFYPALQGRRWPPPSPPRSQGGAHLPPSKQWAAASVYSVRGVHCIFRRAPSLAAGRPDPPAGGRLRPAGPQGGAPEDDRQGLVPQAHQPPGQPPPARVPLGRLGGTYAALRLRGPALRQRAARGAGRTGRSAGSTGCGPSSGLGCSTWPSTRTSSSRSSGPGGRAASNGNDSISFGRTGAPNAINCSRVAFLRKPSDAGLTGSSDERRPAWLARSRPEWQAEPPVAAATNS